MYYVYLLRSENGGFSYVGVTNDLQRRFNEHNKGQSVVTKTNAPWKLIYYEAFMTKKLAEEREKKLKHHGRGLSELKKRVGF